MFTGFTAAIQQHGFESLIQHTSVPVLFLFISGKSDTAREDEQELSRGEKAQPTAICWWAAVLVITTCPQLHQEMPKQKLKILLILQSIFSKQLIFHLQLH